MCGIVGVFSFAGAAVEARTLTAMRDVLEHRGPDGAGLWISPDRGVGLGHRRLSIIDLSVAAAQPMPNEDGSIQVVFNGEIYNHAEIRAELERLGGHVWRTDHSDTEVIVHAYEQWGIDCIDRFRGDFAIAIWDARARQLCLVRDRAGVKPLYYTFLPGAVAFASEIKALLVLPGVERRMNEQALYHYLSFLTTPAPTTMFEGIYKLPVATRLIVDATGRQQCTRYWDGLDHTRSWRGAKERDIEEAVLAELRTAVRYRNVSDVPVGIFLSGGIDSSVNAVLFSESGEKVRTFSIGFDAQYASYADELPHAARMASMLNAEHHVRRLESQDVLDFAERMVYHQDEPIADVVCVPLYYVAKLARDAGVIVCQVGEGSDELFCGYPFWRRHLQLARYNAWPVPAWAKRSALAAMHGARLEGSYLYEVMRRAARGEPTFWGGAEGLTEWEKRRVLGHDLKKRFAGLTSADALRPILHDYEAKTQDRGALQWMTYLDLNLRLPELLLARVDKMTMAASVEARVPFLDHKMIELALSIPTPVRGGTSELKRVLKGAVRGLIPDDVINRRKQGFGLPMHEWLRGALGDAVHARLLRFARTTGVLDVEAAAALARSADWAKTWVFYNLAAWHERFIEKAALE